ncbi:MAG: hypothetical protein FWG02_06570 [Holophagaceae bacterium]|nr:hypothetical protein [Holophagaceae bacterium]
MNEQIYMKYTFVLIIVAIISIIGLTIVNGLKVAPIPSEVIKTLSIFLFVMTGAFFIPMIKRLFTKAQ